MNKQGTEGYGLFAEHQERAFTLGLAGLLGEDVYNFGELLMHPVLESLRTTDKQWLIDTLHAFNSGNVEKFQALKASWGQQPDLRANELRLMQKIQLLCLMEMTFTRPANHRQLTFKEISQIAKVPISEVELLVMKALSVGLVKGSIDEVDERVHMTWVQPRVLDLQQVKETLSLEMKNLWRLESSLRDQSDIIFQSLDLLKQVTGLNLLLS
eukprot:g37456.t1